MKLLYITSVSLCLKKKKRHIYYYKNICMTAMKKIEFLNDFNIIKSKILLQFNFYLFQLYFKKTKKNINFFLNQKKNSKKENSITF